MLLKFFTATEEFSRGPGEAWPVAALRMLETVSLKCVRSCAIAPEVAGVPKHRALHGGARTSASLDP